MHADLDPRSPRALAVMLALGFGLAACDDTASKAPSPAPEPKAAKSVDEADARSGPAKSDEDDDELADDAEDPEADDDDDDDEVVE